MIRKLVLILAIVISLVASAGADISNFVAPYANGQPVLTLEDPSNPQSIIYLKDGVRTGGWAVLSIIEPTVIIQIETSKTVMDLLKADPRYIWIEDISEDE